MIVNLMDCSIIVSNGKVIEQSSKIPISLLNRILEISKYVDNDLWYDQKNDYFIGYDDNEDKFMIRECWE